MLRLGQGQFANIKDLTKFYTLLRPEAVGSSFTVTSINGTLNLYFVVPSLIISSGGQNSQVPSQAGDEANLDTQVRQYLLFTVVTRTLELTRRLVCVWFDVPNASYCLHHSRLTALYP